MKKIHGERFVAAGADLRTLRKSRSMTLVELAQAMGRSIGWMSQVERDISRIESDDLEKLSRILDVAPSLLVTTEVAISREAGRIVRADGRRSLGFRHKGLIETLISPDLTDSFEIVHSIFLPGEELETTLQRDTQELGFMLSGKLDLWFGSEKFVVGPGDSFRIRNEPYRWANPYTRAAAALWAISPPIY